MLACNQVCDFGVLEVAPVDVPVRSPSSPRPWGRQPQAAGDPAVRNERSRQADLAAAGLM